MLITHITELRTALDQAYQAAGRPVPVYTGPTLTAGMVIKGVHLSELWTALGVPEAVQKPKSQGAGRRSGPLCWFWDCRVLS